MSQQNKFDSIIDGYWNNLKEIVSTSKYLRPIVIAVAILFYLGSLLALFGLINSYLISTRYTKNYNYKTLLDWQFSDLGVLWILLFIILLFVATRLTRLTDKTQSGNKKNELFKSKLY